MLTELGLPTIEDRYCKLISNQIIKISQFKNNVIFNDATNFSKLKRIPKIETTIASITKSANNLSISLNKPSNFRVHFPPWTNTETHFIKTTNIAKKNYNSDQIIQQHLEQINTYKKQNYIIWYCDGSKTASGNAFAR